MNGDRLSLKKLYEFVDNHLDNREAPRIERTKLGSDYTNLCRAITESVSELQGFYLWGCYSRRGGLWRNIYLGMAGFGKNKKNLRKRITEELIDERAFIWRFVYTADELMKIRRHIHGNRYVREWHRSIRKAGTTHIVWVAAPALRQDRVRDVGADLIEALSPRANLQRHAPPGDLQGEAFEIFKTFRKLIHDGRKDGFPLNVKGGYTREELLPA